MSLYEGFTYGHAVLCVVVAQLTRQSALLLQEQSQLVFLKIPSCQQGYLRLQMSPPFSIIGRRGISSLLINLSSPKASQGFRSHLTCSSHASALDI